MSGDFSVNGLGGIKPFQTPGNKPAGGPQGNSNSLFTNTGGDTFTRSSNPLGIPGGLTIAGVPVKLDTSSLHPSTLNTLQNPPEHYSAFPPFTDVNG